MMRIFFWQPEVTEYFSMLGLPESPKPDKLVETVIIIPFGREQLQVIHTPGHTPGGICLYSKPNCFTGDTLFVGGVGRTDFPGGSTGELLNSIRNRLLVLPEETIVWPGHGYGGSRSTIGEEARSNPFLHGSFPVARLFQSSIHPVCSCEAMREIILGTAGHVDHGKTSLIRALTGIDTDRLKEEKERGITIELGFAYLDLPCGHRIGIVDVPGHEKFVRNMVAGAAGMDLVAFVIAADEGIMPQTREHFEICQLLGINGRHNRPDQKGHGQRGMAGNGRRGCPGILQRHLSGSRPDRRRLIGHRRRNRSGRCSSLTRRSASSPFQEEFGPFRLAVDRVFSMKGFGTVITGSSMNGRIAVGEELEFYPAQVMAKIRGIQVHGKDVDLVEAGHRTAINLQGIEKDQINRGDMAATPGSLVNSTLLDADFHYLESNPEKIEKPDPGAGPCRDQGNNRPDRLHGNG